MMLFEDFIQSLSKEDKDNFEEYSKIRGVQQYFIIFEALKRKDSNVTYKDVNSFIRYDKAIKDVLFKFLGTLEEYLRNRIIKIFDFANNKKFECKEYHDIDKLPKCIRKDNPDDSINEFYKHFALNFGDLVDFIKKYLPDEFDVLSLNKIVRLRNDVMHHKPLLFQFNSNPRKDVTSTRIKNLLQQLPGKYPEYLKEEINEKTAKTKKNINEKYKFYLLKDF